VTPSEFFKSNVLGIFLLSLLESLVGTFLYEHSSNRALREPLQPRIEPSGDRAELPAAATVNPSPSAPSSVARVAFPKVTLPRATARQLTTVTTAPVPPATPSSVVAPFDRKAPTADTHPAKALLLVIAQPTDASIYLDDGYLGTSADLAGGIPLAPGEHLLDVVRYVFAGYERAITASGGEESRIKVELRKGPTGGIPRRHAPAAPPDANLTDHLKGLAIRIFCAASLSDQGEALRGHLSELGATVVLEGLRTGTRVSGVVIGAAKAVRAVAADLRSLPLVEAIDTESEEITVWIAE
jgi:PEGA domain